MSFQTVGSHMLHLSLQVTGFVGGVHSCTAKYAVVAA